MTYQWIMHKSRCPEKLWDFGLTYTANLQMQLVCDTLDGRTLFEITTGETPDIREYINFPFYGWCKFIDLHEYDGKTLGHWLRPAETVGAPLTYYILKSTGQVVA